MIAAAALVVLTACKEKKQTQEIIVPRQEVRKPGAPISMQVYKQSNDVKWNGKTYHIEIVRTPVDSLPMVKDEIGQKYVDNRIKLTISLQDSIIFYRKSFSKESFASYLDDDYYRNGILEAMIFEEVTDDKLSFAVSVAHPQADDEFIPLTMKLDRDKGLSIKRDNDIDTRGQGTEEEDDGV